MRASTLWLVNVALLTLHAAGAALAWSYLPPRIPIHFGLGGNPDAWADTSYFSWFGLLAISCGLSWFIYALTMHGPLELWNFPEKKRFLGLSPEKQAPIIARLHAFGALSAIAATATLLALQIGIWLAARGVAGALPEYILFFVFGIPAVLVVTVLRWSRSVGRDILAASA